MKKEVLFPYHHSLQILSIIYGSISGTPIEKIDRLEKKGVIDAAFAEDLKAAAAHVLSLYIRQQRQDVQKGRTPSSMFYFARLSTREKEELILSLRTMKELQNQVFAYFSL